MRYVLIALTVALLVAPAYAQRGSAPSQGQQSDPTEQQQAAEKKKRAKEQEEAYRASLKKIPDKKAPDDPWKNIR